MKKQSNPLPPDIVEDLLSVLRERFEATPDRLSGVSWESTETRLRAHPEKLTALREMALSGGEPAVVSVDPASGEVVIMDCAPETPAERRSLCFDEEALASRKRDKPAGSAEGRAHAMGVELLTEEQYFELQKLGEFDQKTSSWLATPADVRARGGALFGDRRFGRVFVYHNGAESYYAARGFRSCLKI